MELHTKVSKCHHLLLEPTLNKAVGNLNVPLTPAYNKLQNWVGFLNYFLFLLKEVK